MASYIKGKNANKPHTIRYWVDGRQREKSFKTKREADDFKAKVEFETREHIFVDPRESAVKFSDAAERYVQNMTGAATSKVIYRRLLINHINPLIGNKSLRQVASDRFGLEELLKVTLPKRGLGASQVKSAYVIIRAVVNSAIKAGKLSQSRINGIRLPVPPVRANIVFVSHAQLEEMVKRMGDHGLALWLMRGCGLRMGEALAVRWENIDPVAGTLRVTEQLAPDGSYVPLKHRSEGDFRDIPIPAYVLRALYGGQQCERADRYGYVFPNANRSTFSHLFSKARREVGLPEDFTSHVLRHIFASVSLSNGIPITDVSKWLGHRNINMTFSIYGHLVPSSVGNARHVLQNEYDTWRETS